ncbi:hypothetical protein F5X68DRAFT_58425 [Plectosphaerella plurivora]|uniref:Uncharacterized protein n=1 Tax=Plectosphaerella plurivora TaxID=936078 RepID=A0A9P8VIN8_9PEZI|nr:hypothetical protein F5X68DRAFT_58425 [Plectosphaerella plurivora]
MYAPGGQYSNAASNFNNAAPPPNQQNYPMQQPGSVPAQPGQQQMMYNPNRFAMPGGAQGAAAPGPGGFPGQPNPGMMPGAGPAGMMQNTAMPQMAANGQSESPVLAPIHPSPLLSPPRHLVVYHLSSRFTAVLPLSSRSPLLALLASPPEPDCLSQTRVA